MLDCASNNRLQYFWCTLDTHMPLLVGLQTMTGSTLKFSFAVQDMKRGSTLSAGTEAMVWGS